MSSGAVTAEREAPLRAVELHRRDAEVVQHAVEGRVDRQASSSSSENTDADGSESVPEPGESFRASVEGLGIAVEADHHLDAGLQQRLGVTARPERHVHDRAAPGEEAHDLRPP